MRGLLTAVFAGAMCLRLASFGIAADTPHPDILFDFEQPTDEWVASASGKSPCVVKISSDRAKSGKQSLKVYGKLPGSFGVAYTPWQDWTGYTMLSFDVYIPGDVKNDFDLWVYLKDKQYLWYQTPAFKNPKTLKPNGKLKPGNWCHVDLDISEQSTIWLPGGHEKAWERSLYYPREFGFRLFGQKSWEGSVYFDNIRLSGNQMPLGKFDPAQTVKPKTGLSVEQSATSVPEYGKLEVTFRMDRRYENPYDPEVADIQGHFTGPSGTTMDVPAFYYQAYRRTQTKDGFEQLIPVGKSCWKVRFAGMEPGPYTYTISVRDALGEIRSDTRKFTVTPPKDPRGYVRVSTKDPKYFEFENGQFFYPIGINMRDGGDQARAQKGTYDFDDYFKSFHDEGLNFVRNWMCAWWGGIEWSDKYDSRFDGVGRYSMYNAWRLDYAVDLAEKDDLFLEITLNSHGQIRRDKFDAEWEYNPYSVKNGGFVASPAMFFTDERVKKLYKQRYRYIVARWGYSQHVMTWDMWNEVDLVEGYNPQQVGAWHQEMGSYLKQIDPWKHCVATHYALHWGVGDELWRQPAIEYIQADSYWGKTVWHDMNQGYVSREAYNKPYMIIEYGPQTATLPISYEEWQRNFRVGQWTSTILPRSSAAQFWYNDAWKQYKLYDFQKPVMKFNEGEDRRNQNLVRVTAVTTPRDAGFVQCMANAKSAYLYVFNWDRMIFADPTKVSPKLTGVSVTVRGMDDGQYNVEFWDTVKGEVASRGTVESKGGMLKLALPDFAQDIAVKVKTG
jgi:hypothetical protein